jgi:hypothetical protein
MRALEPVLPLAPVATLDRSLTRLAAYARLAFGPSRR